MAATPLFDREQLIATLTELARQRLASTEADLAQTFFGAYFHRVPSDDLATSDPEDLYAGALAHLDLGRQRQPGQPLLRAYNPTEAQQGRTSHHTVVEAVVDDIAFLVDSVSMALNRLGYTIHLTIHPVLRVGRDKSGTLTTLNHRSADAQPESFLCFYISRESRPERLDAIVFELTRVLDEASAANADRTTMRKLALSLAQNLDDTDAPAGHGTRSEASALCRWIAQDNFTFLGAVTYEMSSTDDGLLSPKASSALGILRPRDGLDLAGRLSVLPESNAAGLRDNDPVMVTKSSKRSLVHRPAYMDVLFVRHANAKGELTGETCLVGLFSAGAYNRSVVDIPGPRQKLQHVLTRSGLPEHGHGIKVLQNLIERYPRDDLFQITEDELYATAMGMLDLQERQRTRLFVRRDRFSRFYSCLVFVPRDRFNSDLRQKIGDTLMKAYGGQSYEFNVYFSESVLTRIHYLISVDPLTVSSPDTRQVESRIEELTRSWPDELSTLLQDRYGESEGLTRAQDWGGGFPTAFREEFSPAQGADHLVQVMSADAQQHLEITLHQSPGYSTHRAQLRLYSPGSAIVLSDVLPVIENLGLHVLTENPFRVRSASGRVVFIHLFDLADRDERDIEIDNSKADFEHLFQRIWRGDTDNDGFNRLALRAQLNWQQTTLLRAAYRYLKQIRFRYSQDYVIDTLAGNPHMAQRIVRLFEARFDPDLHDDRTVKVDGIRADINQGLERVTNLDEDRILSAYVNLIESMLRTSYFQQHDQQQPERLSFKIDGGAISRMPRPRPMVEIFVFSARVEAVHLRGGLVARGGLRWSDRPEDFRTEVLGLVKAQIVKNAVIVPVGSKGGFIVRRLAQCTPEERPAEVKSCYQTFIRGMLDLTDNRRHQAVIPPSRVVRYDQDDPYLVVAADKGTTTFSDLANEVAAEYDYWLGDAFASGGGTGYDHKAMGITARGAWESVKRLFRDLDINTRTQPFSVMGIGDMSGDVFGNGLLLSRQIRLIGAFNHLHIFIDPNPDPAISFAERERLFQLPRSNWTDYDPKVISEGGGIWPRDAKSIDLSEAARKALGISATTLSPDELIHEMLKSPVDLLFNGGIGTYVKASTESQESVGDRVNDMVRVDAPDLRCRVIGEGGNLGLTQLARIEYSRHGGLCHTDAIDNAAGVDTSDHEVNIKILLNAAVDAEEISVEERNNLLRDMTEEVAQLVLRNNYTQTQALALAVDHAPSLIHQHARALRQLEQTYGLDRTLEYLPDEEELKERIAQKKGLTRPELAVLLSHSKIATFQILLDSDVPEDTFLAEDLQRYFPAALSPRFEGFMADHRLRREIIATHVSNSMINRVGPGVTLRMNELTGAHPAETARAYAAAREIFRLRELWQDIEGLDNAVVSRIQKELMHETRILLQQAVLWLLRYRPRPIDIASAVSEFRDAVDHLRRGFPRVLAASNRLAQKRRVRRYLNAEVPPGIANHVAELTGLAKALDIVDVANKDTFGIAQVATVYFDIGDRLDLHWLSDR
ncbi:MAG: NAD-glutamate dehydrogenase, partial [Arenicellales bacterium]